MIFYLVRHGQTDWNNEKRMQGHADIPMNDTGIQQINDLADKIAKEGIRFDKLIASPLNRARTSAEIIREKTGFREGIVIDEDFIERDCGELEGEIWHPGLDLDDPAYGMETVPDLCERAKKALEKYDFAEDERVMIVAHGAILTAVRTVLSDYRMDYNDRKIPVIQGDVLCCKKAAGRETVFFNMSKIIPENIEWLFFDVGSTLVSEDKPFLHRLHEIAEATGEPFEAIQDKVLQLYKENKKGERVLIKEYGIERPRWRSEDEELYPESYECLQRLSRQYKIGVIANQLPGTAARLEKHGILKFIDVVIASAEEGLEKPDLKIFELALSRANCKPERAAMIGDRVDNDIIPARKLGMKTVRVRQGMWKYWEAGSKEEQADTEVADMSGVLALFER